MTNKNGKLPEGWRMVRFDEIAQNVNDRVDPAETDLDVYVGLEHLDPESLKIRRWGTPDNVIGQKLGFQEGDIIFGKRRAYQRKLAVAECAGICSAHAMVLRAKANAVVPEFLPYLIQSNIFMERAVDISVGSLSPTINWKTLRIQKFMIPPIGEQRRIASILKATDNVIEDFGESATACDRLRRVLLFDFMSGRASNEQTQETDVGHIPSSWSVFRVGEAGNVQLGRQRAPKYQTGKHTKPYLRVANVFDGHFDFSDVLEMDFDERDFETYLLEPGDILLNEGQSRELVGRCAIYGGEIEDCCFQNTLVRFRAGNRLLPKFAFSYFQYLFYKGVFASISRQTTSIAHLGAERFSKLPMAVPPLPEQERIVNTLNAVVNECRRIERHRGFVNHIKRGMMDASLSGKLTHKGPQ